jgi:two-component sensor histidine kinase/CheY-like chemotaxis protein
MNNSANHNGTVLVVDDNPANLAVLFECLRQANFRVLIAEDGTSALKRVAHSQPDIILLDVRMPDTDGFELYQQLKTTYGLNDTPVIFLSVVSDTSEKVRAFDLNAVDYITKPFVADEVVARVHKHLTLRNLRKSLEQNNKELEQEIAERKQAEKNLKAALDEKDVLLKEVHHRVKNNMMALSGLIEMQTRQLDNPKVVEPLRELQTRIRAMGLVHRNLYQSPDLTQIDFGAHLRELINDLAYAHAANGNVKWFIEAEDIFLPVNSAIPCSLIVNELATNVFKHGFPKPTPDAEMRVRCTHTDTEYTLQVVDNGVGLPPDFDWRNTPSLGLSLVNLLSIHQLRGSLELDQQDGTTVTVRFEAD